MNLEGAVLRDINQSQKDKYCMIPFLRGICCSQTHRSRKWHGGGQGLGGGGKGELLCNGYRDSVMQDEKV